VTEAESAVEVAWLVDGHPLADEAVVAAVRAALAHGERAGLSLSVVFTDDDELARMHEEWLGDPSVTDVISFDLGEDGGGAAGELYVSVDRAREVAAERGVAVARELALYVVHGTLHLCGFDDVDDDDRARMRSAEASVLRELGYPDDAAPHDR
jgi:probable rRNA maturation factor